MMNSLFLLMQKILAPVQQWLWDEQARWLLWAPLAMGLGIVLNFAYGNHLGEWFGASLMGFGAPALAFWRKRIVARVLLIALLLVGIGYVSMQWQTERLRQPLLNYSSPVLPLEASLIGLIEENESQKLVLTDITVEGGTRIALPTTIRLSLKKKNPDLKAGQRVKLRGGMFPLPEPAMPRGFDFSRHFYFKGIGAVGFAVAPVEVLSQQVESSFFIALNRFRNQLTQHIQAVVGVNQNSDVAAISSALITAERSGISEEAKEAMRAAGLAHMLAISGLHLGLVCGVLFLLLRSMLLLIPALALRYPLKKWAAAGALLGGLAYLALAGFPVSAQRAYAMVALVLVAVIIDRQVYPMRSLALAALLILAIDPAALMGPSFQLSFAATMGVIALYELWRKRQRETKNPTLRGFGSKIVLYFVGVTATTFIASLITAPLVIYHFNQFTLYHIFANIAASPILSFMVMPAAVLHMILLPFGIGDFALHIMGYGVSWILATATYTESLPYSMIHVVTPPVGALIGVILGLCWLCFWQSRIRLLGLLIIGLSLVPYFMSQTADLYISEKAEQVAYKMENGSYAMLQGSARNFKAGLWKEALNVEQFAKADSVKNLRCDNQGCLLTHGKTIIALPKTRLAAQEDCADSDLVITRFRIRNCQARTIASPYDSASVNVRESKIEITYSKSFIDKLLNR